MVVYHFVLGLLGCRATCLLTRSCCYSSVGRRAASAHTPSDGIIFVLSLLQKAREISLMKLSRWMCKCRGLFFAVPFYAFARGVANDDPQSFVLEGSEGVRGIPQASYPPLPRVVELLGEVAALPEGVRFERAVLQLCVRRVGSPRCRGEHDKVSGIADSRHQFVDVKALLEYVYNQRFLEGIIFVCRRLGQPWMKRARELDVGLVLCEKTVSD